MIECYLCGGAATLISKPAVSRSFVECGYCIDYILEDVLINLSQGVRRDASKYSHNHSRYPGETLIFYKITRTYKECPNKIQLLSCRIKKP